MQQTYLELEPNGDFGHLAETVDQYLSRETPLWLVRFSGQAGGTGLGARRENPIACLWLGTAIDQQRGNRHTHIFLLYVEPAHRHKGIGTALMRHAEEFARARGDRQIGLQVFRSNLTALRLYEHLGYQVQSLWMVKPLLE